MGQKAIIFGVTGQDGSYLSELLLEKGYEVVGVVRRSSIDNTVRLKGVIDNPKFSLVTGDITDAHSVGKVLRAHSDTREVYNLAAQSHVGESFNQPATTWDITGKGCLNILQCLVDLDMKHVRFYQASSSEMFGAAYDEKILVDGNGFPWGRERSQSETTKFLPQSPYAIAKCAAHYITRLFREAYGMHASAGILFNHEGPRRGENFVTRKITKWIGNFMCWHDEQASIYPVSEKILDPDHPEHIFPFESPFGYPKLRLGNLDAYRDWGFAGDYVEAMWMMLQRDTPDDYVICTGQTHTIREFLDIAFKRVGIENWTDYVAIDPQFYRPAEVDYLRGNNHKAQSVLGWKPKHSFEQLVQLMVDHDINEKLQSNS